MLSNQEAEAFSRFAQAAIAVKDTADFERVVRAEVKALLPHGMLLAVVGQLNFDQLSIHHRVGVGYEPWMIDAIPMHINIRERPVIGRWLSDREPKVVDLAADRHWLSPREAAEIEAFELGRIAVHGLPDIATNMASYFSLARLPTSLDPARISYLLTLICPLLHGALLNAQAHDAAPPLTVLLTAIERELLMWIAAGRSNAEIALLRGRSVTTVRNQLSALYKKLDVGTRAEALAYAFQAARSYE